MGYQKCGKTTVLSYLPRALHIDMENGTDYVEAYAIKANTYTKLYEIAMALKRNSNQFDFVILDTITLEVLPYANKLYRDTPMGSKFLILVLTLLSFLMAGYLLREAMQNVIGWFTKVCPNIILVGR